MKRILPLCCLVAMLLVAASMPAAPSHKTEAAVERWHSHSPQPGSTARYWQEPGHRSPVLGISGIGTKGMDGRWIREVPVEPGNTYEFTTQYKAEQVDVPQRSILTRLIWTDSKGNRVGTPEFPATAREPAADGWTNISGTYTAPPDATGATLELHLRWAPEGQVLFRDTRFQPASPSEPRTVRLATIHHRPRNSTPDGNLIAFGALLDQAAAKQPDIVCLPEGITVVGTKSSYVDVAEPVPGPTTKILGEYAKKHDFYIVAGIYEQAPDSEAVYNTSVLIDRQGELVGRYRKVCLPREEIDGGITPGTEYPVFDTDFGRVGMMICWDVHFPEVARQMASQGAEVILVPIWGGNEMLARARAIENQLYLVTSGYDFTSAIYDRKGEPLAVAEEDGDILVSEIDLNEREMWWWLGDWRSRIWREAPPPREG